MPFQVQPWLRAILAPLKPVFREVLAVSFFINLLALAVPIFIQQVYDRVVFHAGLSTLQALLIGMTVLLVFDFVLRQARARVMQAVALKIDVAVGETLFGKLMNLPLRRLETRPGAFWQLLFRDVDVVRNTLSGASAVLICDLPFVVLFLAMMFVMAMPVAVVFLVIIPIYIFMGWRAANRIQAAHAEERDSQQARDTLLTELIGARGLVKALTMEQAVRPLWESRQAATIRCSMQRGSEADATMNMGLVLTSATTVALTSVGALHIIDHSMSMGALVAVNMLAGRLMGPINQLVSGWRTYAGFRQSVERLDKLFAEDEDRTQATLAASSRPRGQLTLEQVNFSYDPQAKPVIEEMQLALPPFGVTALVGRNGCGKTTLLKLLMGLYRPDKGRVLLDGADLAQFTRQELAGWIGYVPQDCILFSGSVRDNIAHGHPMADDEEILRAAKLAGVHPYIVDLPDGYASDVGEAGARLSVGQRQRIAIARALLGDPPVLVLDEPSSSLDRQAEEDLRATLTELGKSHAVIMVTHSPVLLPAADFVVALDKGKVAMAGPAREVLPRLFARPAAQPQPQGAPA